jgi:hypothetical protein
MPLVARLLVGTALSTAYPHAACGLPVGVAPVVPNGAQVRCTGHLRYRVGLDPREMTSLARFVRLETSDPAVLRVDAEGVVHAIAPGQASVMATFLWMTASRPITVSARPAR